MSTLRTEAEARGLTEAELIHQLETGQLSVSSIFPALQDELAFESWLADRGRG